MISQQDIEKDYVNAKKAGEILNLSPSRISRLCSQGRFIGAFKAGGSWLIPRKAIETHKPLPPGPKSQEFKDSHFLATIINEANNLKEDDNHDQQ